MRLSQTKKDTVGLFSVSFLSEATYSVVKMFCVSPTPRRRSHPERQLIREMAGDEMLCPTAACWKQRGFDLRAFVLRIGAARVKIAAARRIRRIRHVARQLNLIAVPALARIRNRYR